MADPSTTLHYAPNGNFTNGPYDPGVAGFNLADVSSKSNLDALPAGVQGLVYLGDTGGDTPAFEAQVAPYIGDPNVYGFYLADEPDPNVVPAANLKAESDYIHTHDPGVQTFIVQYNDGTPIAPSYGYNSANTDIDLFGLDPYPIRPASEGYGFNHGYNFSVIKDAITEANSIGVADSQIVPVYQAFGGGQYPSYTLPTAGQEAEILQTWARDGIKTPAFDYAYSWGTQTDNAIVNTPALQAAFDMHNTGKSVMAATDTGGTSSLLNMIPSGSRTTTVGAGSVTQNVSGGVSTVTFANITSETVMLGPSTGPAMSFIGPGALTAVADVGNHTVTADSGTNDFTAGVGTLDVTGGSGDGTFHFHAGDKLLTIEDFNYSRDTLVVDKSLQSTLVETTDGHGGSLLTFGTGHSVDVANIGNFDTSQIHFV